MAPKSVTFRRHDVSVLFGDLLSHSYNITFSMFVLMEFKRSCRLSFTTMAMLLNLLQLICPTGNKLPTTKYQLLRFAVSSNNTHSRIDYCRFCATKLQRNQRCPSSSCQRSEPNNIILVSPENTLQHIISGNKYLCICIGMLWTN